MRVLAGDMVTAGQREIGALTGIRGLAACYVVAYHLHLHDRRLLVPATLLGHGYLAVDVFFVLSGFVMTLSYGHMFASGTTVRGYLVFLLRRLARVYPLYLALLVVTVVFLLLSPRHHLLLTPSFGRTLLFNSLMVQAWGLDYSLNGPSWSISTELAAYLLFPVLLLVAGRRVPPPVSAIVCLLVVVLAAAQPTPNPVLLPRSGLLDVYWPDSPWPVARCVSEFALGIVAFRLAERKPPLLPGHVVLPVGLAALALLFVPRCDVVFVCLVPLLLIGITDRGNAVSRFLASPAPMVLGRWSYAIYLCHFVLFGVDYRVAALGSRVLPPLAAAIVGEFAFWTVLFGLAALSFRLVEVPGRRAVRRLEARLFPTEHRLVVASELSGVEAARDTA